MDVSLEPLLGRMGSVILANVPPDRAVEVVLDCVVRPAWEVLRYF